MKDTFNRLIWELNGTFHVASFCHATELTYAPAYVLHYAVTEIIATIVRDRRIVVTGQCSTARDAFLQWLMIILVTFRWHISRVALL